MWRVHVMTFHPIGIRKQILDTLDAIPDVKNWRATTGGIFIVTEVDVSTNALAMNIHSRLPNVRFILAGVAGATQGNSETETWDFLNNPRPSPGRS
jgi:hypothetical protein